MEREAIQGISANSKISADKKDMVPGGKAGPIAFEIIRITSSVLPPRNLSRDELLEREAIYLKGTIYQ